jgi:small subunit ribosomal protein S9
MLIINAIVIIKTSFARIYLQPVNGDIKVNNRVFKEFFLSDFHQTTVKQALAAIKAEDQYDVTVNVEGGGVKGQAEAVRLGIARALVQITDEHRPALKKDRLLTRDSRMVERKKPGRRKARRRFQFSKR